MNKNYTFKEFITKFKEEFYDNISKMSTDVCELTGNNFIRAKDVGYLIGRILDDLEVRNFNDKDYITNQFTEYSLFVKTENFVNHVIYIELETEEICDLVQIRYDRETDERVVEISEGLYNQILIFDSDENDLFTIDKLMNTPMEQLGDILIYRISLFNYQRLSEIIPEIIDKLKKTYDEYNLTTKTLQNPLLEQNYREWILKTNLGGITDDFTEKT